MPNDNGVCRIERNLVLALPGKHPDVDRPRNLFSFLEGMGIVPPARRRAWVFTPTLSTDISSDLWPGADRARNAGRFDPVTCGEHLRAVCLLDPYLFHLLWPSGIQDARIPGRTLGCITDLSVAVGSDDCNACLNCVEVTMTSISIWAKKRPLLSFFLLAYVLSWVVEIPLVLKAKGIIQTEIPFSLHYLAAYGPMLSALIVTGLTGGSRGLQELLGRMTKWRVNPVWWLVTAAPLGFNLLITVALWLIQGVRIDILAMGQVDFLPALGLAALPMWILTFGIGEETGWRGFALPRLQKDRSAFSATLILWVVWALWHLPLFFYSYNITILPGFLLGLLAGTITFTWLYNSTGGSVLLVALWHGAFNFTTACVTCKTGLSTAVISTLVMVWAVGVVLLFKPARLSRSEKQVINKERKNLMNNNIQ